jgi:poly(3-hydroxybutyrate) depolymerase
MDKYFRKYQPRFRASSVLSEPTKAAEIVTVEIFGQQSVIADIQGEGSGIASASGQLSAVGNVAGQSNGQGSASGVLSVAPAPASWTARPNTPMSASNVQGFWEFLPEGWNTGPKPVIICFHGSGERGDGITNLNLVLNQGLPNLINSRFGFGNSFPYDAIVLAPQYAGSQLTSGRVQDCINYAKNNYDINESRIYLTGLSLGAEGITNWWFNGTLEDVAACLIISTPSGYYEDGAVRAVLANLPCFFVHGLADSNPFTPYTKSERWVNGWNDGGWPGLNGLGIQPPAILKLLPDVDHSSEAWNSAHDWQPVSKNSIPLNDYGGGLIMDWLLAQQRLPAEYIRATSNAQASGTGQMSGAGSMQGQSQGQADATGNMTPSMQGQANGQANASGQLSGDGNFQGGAQGQGGGNGQLSGDGQIHGQANSQGGGSGQLSGIAEMQGQSDGTSNGIGSMDAGAMAGQGSGEASGSGQLQGPASIQGQAEGQGQGIGQISGDASMTASGAGQAIVEGVGYADGLLSGQSGGSSSAIGTLSESGVMELTDVLESSRVETQIAADSKVFSNVVESSNTETQFAANSKIESIVLL